MSLSVSGGCAMIGSLGSWPLMMMSASIIWVEPKGESCWSNIVSTTTGSTHKYNVCHCSWSCEFTLQLSVHTKFKFILISNFYCNFSFYLHLDFYFWSWSFLCHVFHIKLSFIHLYKILNITRDKHLSLVFRTGLKNSNPNSNLCVVVKCFDLTRRKSTYHISTSQQLLIWSDVVQMWLKKTQWNHLFLHFHTYKPWF